MTGRFYLFDPVSGNTASIADAAQLHHLRDVLRLKVGGRVSLFDGAGNEYSGTIASLNKTWATIEIQSRQPAPVKKFKLSIACSIPKKAKMDDIVDKLTQLGVDVILPLETERGIVRLGEDSTRLERWRKIALNAAEQSHRQTLPQIGPARNLAGVLKEAKEHDLKLIPTLIGPTRPLKKALAGVKPTAILALIGPEGDFTPAEVEEALKAGFRPVSLGDTVLRVETAAIAVASFLRFTLI